MIDTTTPAPGPYRMPTENERRCRIYLEKPFRDCIDLCEVHPDLEEATDPTMRLLASSWEMHQLLRAILAEHVDNGGTDPLKDRELNQLKSILLFVEKGVK